MIYGHSVTGANRSAGTVAHWRCDFVFFKSPPGGHFCREYRCPADKARLARTLSRIVLDALLHVHATAVALGDQTVLLEMHTSDQTLAGKTLRGCGIVFCAKGRALFERALVEARATLAS
jgi:hypothetical protein